MDRLADIDFSGSLKIVTNLMTPDGTKIACTWLSPTENRACMVIGDTIDEVLRKVELLEEELRDFAADVAYDGIED